MLPVGSIGVNRLPKIKRCNIGYKIVAISGIKLLQSLVWFLFDFIFMYCIIMEVSLGISCRMAGPEVSRFCMLLHSNVSFSR